MFTSTAGVFRKRQIVSDLTSYISTSGRVAFARIRSDQDSDSCLDRLIGGQGGRFRMPSDDSVYGDVLLAAALPDEDFPAFTCATALLLLDRIQEGGGSDDLYWNWDAFADYYRLADPAIRALLMNGFRIGSAEGRVSVLSQPKPADCLTKTAEQVLSDLDPLRHRALAKAIETNVEPQEAGRIWLQIASAQPSDAEISAARYLFERPLSIDPGNAKDAPPVPWRL